MFTNLFYTLFYYFIDIYGRIVTSTWCRKKSAITYYVLHQGVMKKVKSIEHLVDYGDCLYYAHIEDPLYESCLVFDRLEVLLDNYLDLVENVRERLPRFRKQLEVIHLATQKDIMPVFNLYTDDTDTFFYDLTQYKLKPLDLYDFNHKQFVLGKTDVVQVVQMDLESKDYASDSPFL